MPTLKKAPSWRSSQTDYKIEQRAVYVALLIKQESLEDIYTRRLSHTTQCIAFPFISRAPSNIWQCSLHITELSVMCRLKAGNQVRMCFSVVLAPDIMSMNHWLNSWWIWHTKLETSGVLKLPSDWLDSSPQFSWLSTTLMIKRKLTCSLVWQWALIYLQDYLKWLIYGCILIRNINVTLPHP